MGRKANSEDNVKPKQRSRHDKARRNFELNGKHSAKHVRAQAQQAEKRALRPPRQTEAPSQPSNRGG